MSSKTIEDGSIDAGLLVLSQITPKGCPLSHRHIAAVCGCTWQNIFHLEKRALRKVREKLRRELHRSYADVSLEDYL